MKKISVLIMFLAVLGLQLAQAQVRQITGTVTSAEDGAPLPGVQIVVVGSTIGAITDVNGNYSIDVPETATTLQFSFVGLTTQAIDIEGKSVIDVVMEEDLQALGEIIVTGYSTRGKNQLTGSTVQVTADKLRDTPVASVDQTLQGKVAGLVINTFSGTPGSRQEIRIRGVSSLTASNDPLFVIDGVPVINEEITGSTAFSSLGSLAAINPDDIESITVLKDASATSAYGARGSNGVIVITTNKGKAGKTRFNFSANYGFQNKAVVGRKELTALQREELYLEAVLNTYGEDYSLETPEQAYDFAVDNNLFGVQQYIAWNALGRPEGNWGEAVLNKNAPTYKVNLSASGGDNTSSFYASLGYMNQESVAIGNLFERLTGQLNYQRKFHDRVNFSTTNTVSYTNQDHIFLETSAYYGNPHMLRYFMPPTIPPYNEDGTPNIDYASVAFNIIYLQENNITWNHMLRFLSNSFVEYEIIDNLKFKSLYAFDWVMGHYKDYRNRYHGDSRDENGSSYMILDQDFNMVFQNSLDYSLNFLDNHRVDLKALIEYQKFKSWYMYAYGENFVTDGLTNVASAGSNFDATSEFSDWANLSYLGMLNYNYMGKYIADFTFRREGSSRFAEDRRFGNFWAVGVAWNMSQENFMQGVSFIDNLRFRGSYGVSGNSGVGLNAFQSLLGYAADYAGAGASYPSGYGNNMLTWEKNRNYDVGFDFAILNNRIDGSFSYFNKETFDLLQNVPLTRTSGFSSITRNVGAMVNTGIETMVNLAAVRTSDFNLNFSFNFATLHNEVTELAKDAEGNDIVISNSYKKVAVGHTYYEWYMQEWAGVNPETGLPQWYVNETDDEGNIVDPDAITENYNEAQRAWMGKSAIPTWSGGGGIHIDFKGIYFDANLYVAGGHLIEEQWDHYTWDNGLYSVGYFNGIEKLLERWQQPGDITDIPKFQFMFRPQNAVSTSSRVLFKGDYMRLKDLVLGYNLPPSILSRLKLTGASIYARGTNMFTYAFDPDTREGYDPETQADGYTGLETPPIKSLVFGINVNF
ncbi:MAG: TonB-dependent receptor [Bacteroidales bacterium]|nr:TonB-dependent receptor [Bacteroidales bacterium]